MLLAPPIHRRRAVAVALAVILTLQFYLLAPGRESGERSWATADVALPPQAVKYQESLSRNQSGISLSALDTLLAGAADANRTIVLLPFNDAYKAVLSNLLCSIRRVEAAESVKLPLVFWPLDEDARKWAQSTGLGPILYDDTLFSVNEWVGYSHDGKKSPYFQMMRERGKMFRKIVHDLGYNIFFLDSDVVVLRNPLSLLRWDSTVEIQVDAWAEDQVVMEEVEPMPGPEEVMQPLETVEGRLAKVMAGPANPKPIPFFRPESEYVNDRTPTACAGAFFLRADEGGRWAAREMERILAERDDVDDQEALNIILHDNAWPRNLAPRNRSAEELAERSRFLTYRYMKQHEAVNGHVFFAFREAYLWFKKRKGLPEPALVHANGVTDKRPSTNGELAATAKGVALDVVDDPGVVDSEHGRCSGRVLLRAKHVMLSAAATQPASSSAPAFEVPMSTDYNRNSKLQAASLLSAVDELCRELTRIIDTLNPRRVVITDLGCSQVTCLLISSAGFVTILLLFSIYPFYIYLDSFLIMFPSQARNSLPVIRALISVAKDTPLDVYMVDLPGNDWDITSQALEPLTSEFGATIVHVDDTQDLHDASHDDHHEADLPKVRLILTPRSFFQPVLPPNSTHLAYSGSAMHWLSHHPPSSSLFGAGGDMYFRALPEDHPVRAEWARQQREDWVRIVKLREAELVAGARWDVARSLGMKGVMTEAEEGKVALSYYIRDESEIRAPFVNRDHEDGDGDARGGKVELMRIESLRMCCMEMPMRAGETAREYADATVASFRAFACNVWRNEGLSEDICEALLEGLRQEVEREPEVFRYRFWQTYLVIRKD
ncbi:hypothetical protein HK101_001374 [Irineochytrium annulatum]|nr:hypothetical protein HK101_001374 [Irineochytrium annulatum]